MNDIRFDDLEKIMHKYKTEKSQISVEIKDFNENMLIEHNTNMKVNSASCIKVAIMIAVLKKVQKNEIELNKIIELKNMNLDDDDSIYNEIEKKSNDIRVVNIYDY